VPENPLWRQDEHGHFFAFTRQQIFADPEGFDPTGQFEGFLARARIGAQAA
jgi:hypothetical protein